MPPSIELTRRQELRVQIETLIAGLLAEPTSLLHMLRLEDQAQAVREKTYLLLGYQVEPSYERRRFRLKLETSLRICSPPYPGWDDETKVYSAKRRIDNSRLIADLRQADTYVLEDEAAVSALRAS